MEVTVTGRHVDVTAPMKEYAQGKAEKLNRFYDRIESVDVILDGDSAGHRVEMVVRADHKHTFVAEAHTQDFYGSVDAAVEKLKHQLNRHKEKYRNRKHPDDMGRAGNTLEPGA